MATVTFTSLCSVSHICRHCESPAERQHVISSPFKSTNLSPHFSLTELTPLARTGNCLWNGSSFGVDGAPSLEVAQGQRETSGPWLGITWRDSFIIPGHNVVHLRLFQDVCMKISSIFLPKEDLALVWSRFLQYIIFHIYLFFHF